MNRNRAVEMRHNQAKFILLIGALFVATLFVTTLTKTQDAYASCREDRRGGHWVNTSASPSLVLTQIIIPACNDTVDKSIGGRYAEDPVRYYQYYTSAKCDYGTRICNWGWHPGTHRPWANGESRQNFELLNTRNGESLKVTTTVTFNNGSTRQFVDYLTRAPGSPYSINGNNPLMRRNPIDYTTASVTASVVKIGTITYDGDNSANEFYGKFWLTRGEYKYNSRKWSISGQVPIKSVSVDVVFELWEDDSGFLGGDDYFDIHPHKNIKYARYRVYLQSGNIYLIDPDSKSRYKYVGKVGDNLPAIRGYHGEDRANLNFKITATYPKKWLSLPN